MRILFVLTSSDCLNILIATVISGSVCICLDSTHTFNISIDIFMRLLSEKNTLLFTPLHPHFCFGRTVIYK